MEDLKAGKWAIILGAVIALESLLLYNSIKFFFLLFFIFGLAVMYRGHTLRSDEPLFKKGKATNEEHTPERPKFCHNCGEKMKQDTAKCPKCGEAQ